MPYIKAEKRPTYDNIVDVLVSELVKDQDNHEGNMNYIITTMILKYLKESDKVNYKELNALIGMLECCKLELYRKHVAVYEDLKEKENGEVMP